MCPAIDNPTSCEICVICFLHAGNMSSVETHRKLCVVVYRQNVISEGTVRQWWKCSKMGEHMFMKKSKMASHL
jgi:hypothetical protein